MNGFLQIDHLTDQRDGIPSIRFLDNRHRNTSWDQPNGHWDNPDGKGNSTRWLPHCGGQVDHDNNPIGRITISPEAAKAAAAVGFWVPWSRGAQKSYKGAAVLAAAP